MLISLPDAITLFGTRGPLAASVRTDLPPGTYTVTLDAARRRFLVHPWASRHWLLSVTIQGSPRELAIYQSYEASLSAPVPLHVVDRRASQAGGLQAARLDAALGRQQAVSLAEMAMLVDMLAGQAASGATTQQQRETRQSWLEWAALLEAMRGRASARGGPDTGMSAAQVRHLLDQHGRRLGIPQGPALTTRQALRHQALARSWHSLHPWEKQLWSDFLARYGDSSDVTSSSRRDLHITDEVRLSMALRMAPRYMRPGAREAFFELVNDPVFARATVLGVGAYLLLWMAPEPVFSKATAFLTTAGLMSMVTFSVSELLALAKAWMRLDDEVSQATTMAELQAAAQRFGAAVGGSAVRILVALSTVVAGKALASTPVGRGAPRPASLQVGPPGGAAAIVASRAVPDAAMAIKVFADGTVRVVRVTQVLAAMQGGRMGGPGASPGPRAIPPARATAPSRTLPSTRPDPNARPRGPRTAIPKNDKLQNQRAYQRENESADVLARAGYNVEQRPPGKPNGKNPDYKIEGEYFDNYAPTSNRPRNIATEMEKKIEKEQVDRIILNLEDTVVEVAAMKKQLTDWPIPNLRELVIIQGGRVIWSWP